MSQAPVPFTTLTGFWGWVVAAYIFIFPSVVVVLDPAGGPLFISFALLGLYLGWRHPNPDPLNKDEKLLLFSVVFFFAVALLAWLISDFSYEGWKKLWRSFRFVLLVPIYLAVRRIAHREDVWWIGLALAGMLAGVLALSSLLITERTLFSDVSLINDPAQFGALSLTMAFMALGGLGFFWHRHKALLLLPVAGFMLGLVASLLAGSRVAWLALPALFLLLFYMVMRRLRRSQRLLLIGGAALLAALLYAVPATGIAERLATLWQELGALFDGRVTGHLRMRLDLWGVAWNLFLDNPLLGAGLGSYGEAVAREVLAGKLPAAYLDYQHPHSEVLGVLASRGLLGLLALGLLFGIPLKHFIWAAGFRDAKMRHLAYGGIVLIVAYIHFALFSGVFERTGPIIFYTVTLGVTFGLLRARERAYLREPVKRKKTLSVIIICMNEADRIRATLESVHGWADEIIVLDSGSGDDTVAICREYTDRVYETDWPGFGKQKQRALDKATCDWVLSIDADEVVSPELRAEIDKELQDDPPHTGYDVHRPVIIFGRIMDFSGSGQSPLRLFRRDAGSFTQVPVHEKVVLAQGTEGRLRGSLYHETYRDYAHAVQKFGEYAWLQANERFRRGKRAGLVGAGLRGLLNFIHNYFIRFGFLDGGRGFVLAALHANYTFNKYAALWMLGLRERLRHEEGGKRD